MYLVKSLMLYDNQCEHIRTCELTYSVRTVVSSLLYVIVLFDLGFKRSRLVSHRIVCASLVIVVRT